MPSVIELCQVEKHYQSGDSKLIALQNINLMIHSGELVAIVGASGSGKSTLLNILGLLDRPTKGEYLLSGKSVAHLEGDEQAAVRNLKIGFVFQSFFLLPKLDAIDNVTLPLMYRDMDRSEAEEKAMAILQKLGIAHLYHHRPNQLSGGQQQRVALARALVGNPEVILADEPTGALDSQTGSEVMSLLKRLNQEEGKTIIIVTHDLDIAAQCPRVVRLQDGHIVSDETRGE